MEILTEKQIVGNIKAGKCFAAEIEGGGFQVRIMRYVPALATAIHEGHRVLEPIAEKMKVTDAERQFEEDPHTGTLAETMDISLTVMNSRYCCDLNRSEDHCLYEEAWGKKVWKEPLDVEDKRTLLQTHETYYRVLDALLSELAGRFGSAVLYDLHSYNYSRWNGSTPLFNIGTHYIDMTRFGTVIHHLTGLLQEIELPDCENRAVSDEVFLGKGYQAEFVHNHHPDVLCVPLELKKVFMDEQSFAIIDDIYMPLFAGIESALKENSEFFEQKTAADSARDGVKN